MNAPFHEACAEYFGSKVTVEPSDEEGSYDVWATDGKCPLCKADLKKSNIPYIEWPDYVACKCTNAEFTVIDGRFRLDKLYPPV